MQTLKRIELPIYVDVINMRPKIYLTFVSPSIKLDKPDIFQILFYRIGQNEQFFLLERCAYIFGFLSYSNFKPAQVAQPMEGPEAA